MFRWSSAPSRIARQNLASTWRVDAGLAPAHLLRSTCPLPCTPPSGLLASSPQNQGLVRDLGVTHAVSVVIGNAVDARDMLWLTMGNSGDLDKASAWDCGWMRSYPEVNFGSQLLRTGVLTS